MKTCFVFGNPLVKEDSVALRVAKELETRKIGVIFKEMESLDDLERIPEELIILDVADGIKKVTVIEDLEKLNYKKVVGSHDFDLGMQLLLYKKIGKIKKIKLFLVPMHYSTKEALKELNAILP